MPGFRVLVVDDECAVRHLTQVFLRNLGHLVQTAASGLEALRLMEDTPFDLVITDLNMPGVKGDELAGQIAERHGKIPVILITGAHLDRALPAFAAVVHKPFSIEQLAQAMAKAAGVSGSI